MEFNLEHTAALTSSSEPWDFSNDDNPKDLEKRMIKFMLDNQGIGLAANQIGITKRVFVMGSETHKDFPKPFALFNPRIIEESNETILDQEGCLSFPGVWLTIKRPAWVIAEYFDSNGIKHQQKFEGYVSKCFQHELDHLNGICFIDKVSKLKLQLALKKQRKKNK
jgi:peptide deformylase